MSGDTALNLKETIIGKSWGILWNDCQPWWYWYATNSDIVEYNELFDRLEFFADNEYVHNPSVKPVWIAVNNNTIVEVKGGETVKL